MGNESSAPQQRVVTKTVVKTVYKERSPKVGKKQSVKNLQKLTQPKVPTPPPLTPPQRTHQKVPISRAPPSYEPPAGSQIPLDRNFDHNIVRRDPRLDTRLPTARMTSFRDNPPATASQTYTPIITPEPMPASIQAPKKRDAVTVNLMNQTIPPLQAPVAPAAPATKTDNSDKFNPEMKSFLKEYDPYKLLRVERTADLKTIKAAYRKLATKYHPDKGGNQDIFDKITKAYTYLKSIASISNVKTPTQDHTSLRKQANDVNQPSAAIRKMYTDNFNIDQFNQQFTDNRMADESTDHGYGSYMTHDSREADANPSSADLLVPETHRPLGQSKRRYNKTTKFNVDVFNEEFKDELQLIKHTTLNPELPESEQAVQVYKEPIAFTSGAQSYSDIDKQRVGDYSSFADPLSASNSQQYSDYMSAFTTRSTFMNAAGEEGRKDYRNLDDLKRDRENISYTMSAEDQAQLQEQAKRQADAENERLRRIAERDHAYEKHSTYVSRQFLGDR